MSLTIATARDDALAVVKAAHDGDPTFNTLKLIWTDSPDDGPPKDGVSYARILFRHVESEQISMADATSKRIFERIGLLTLQGFFAGANGQSVSDEWAQAMLDSLEGLRSPGGIMFRNVRPVEIGNDGDWFNMNVLADFEWDRSK